MIFLFIISTPNESPNDVHEQEDWTTAGYGCDLKVNVSINRVTIYSRG